MTKVKLKLQKHYRTGKQLNISMLSNKTKKSEIHFSTLQIVTEKIVTIDDIRQQIKEALKLVYDDD